MEHTNALSIEDFITHYVTPQNAPAKQPTDTATTNGDEAPHYQPSEQQQQSTTSTPLDIYSAATIPDTDLEACLDLVELTSSEAYAASGGGWSRPKKRKEMKLPDMKFLIVRDTGETGKKSEARADAAPPPTEADEQKAARDPGKANVLGFLSFMITYEDGKEVVYCYEIHLAPSARRHGLGGMLMGRMEEIGRLVGVEKAMLTVFKSNEAARRFYQRGGYVVDEYSPQPRKLRNGTIKEFDYEILSKRLK